jgi:hypothetical protein
MANKNQVWGRTRVRIDGVEYETEGKSKLMPGGIKRTEVQGDYVVGKFTAESQSSKFETTLLVTPALSVDVMRRWDDVTLSLEFDTGQSFTIAHAYLQETPDMSDGKAPLVFMGPEAEEIKV